MNNNECLNTKTKRIEVENNKIIYTLKCNNTKHYFTYNDVLYKILQDNSLHPFSKDNRLVFNRVEGQEQYKIYAHDLAKACYMDKVKVSSYMEDMSIFKKYKKDNKLTIDHIDNYINNNTELNLLLMSSELNTSKGNIITRFEKPYDMTCCNKSEKVIIEFTRPVINSIEVVNWIVGVINISLPYNISVPDFVESKEKPLCTIGYICNTAKDFVSCLQDLSKQTICFDDTPTTQPLKVGDIWNVKGNKLNLDNAILSIQKQENLSNRDFNKFNIYTRNDMNIDNI
ncbi:MAG: hypothetical protein R3Y35_04045 [Clostridia bacterium]